QGTVCERSTMSPPRSATRSRGTGEPPRPGRALLGASEQRGPRRIRERLRVSSHSWQGAVRVRSVETPRNPRRPSAARHESTSYQRLIRRGLSPSPPDDRSLRRAHNDEVVQPRIKVKFIWSGSRALRERDEHFAVRMDDNPWDLLDTVERGIEN